MEKELQQIGSFQYYFKSLSFDTFHQITFSFYEEKPIFIQAKFLGKCVYPIIYTDFVDDPGYFEKIDNQYTIKFSDIGLEWK